MEHQSFFIRTGFDKGRCELLAAICAGDIGTALDGFDGIIAGARSSTRLTEVDQKALNQLLAAVKQWRRRIPASYRERFRRARKALKARLAEVNRQQTLAPEPVSGEAWRCRLERPGTIPTVLLRTVAMVQLTIGCSNACRRCNEWALTGVRSYFTWEAAEQFVLDLAAAGNTGFALYGASDPLDWCPGPHTVADLFSVARQHGVRLEYGLLTKIPRGSKSIAAQLLREGADVAVSLVDGNRDRVERIEKEVGKRFQVHHENRALSIPAGLDDDFASIKSSITDYYGAEITPEGAFQVVPTFTSPLHPTGQARWRVDGETPCFIKKKVGLDALQAEYFKPLTVIDRVGNERALTGLLDPQVENILLDSGLDGPTPPGMMCLAEFFATFDPEAVRQRRRLLPVVIADLKRQRRPFHAPTTPGSGGVPGLIEKKIDAAVAFSRPETVRALRHSAFSFLLHAARRYVLRNPAERTLIAFLRREDAGRRQHRPVAWPAGGAASLGAFLQENRIPSSELFQALLSRLLDNPDDKMIKDYLDAHPAIYDPDLETYVSASCEGPLVEGTPEVNRLP